MKAERFDNHWDALQKTPADVAKMTIRSSLMIAIEQSVKSWNVNQTTAAKRLGLTQPRLIDLLRGRINKFSLDALMTIAAKSGLTVKVQVVRPAA
jgi:predicted XRE-type DNA-binding protein